LLAPDSYDYVVTRKEGRAMAHKSVLFLCTGNYYRSRFAEMLFNSLAAQVGLQWRASSRGLALERGVNNIGSMDASAAKALQALGVGVGDGYRRRRLTEAKFGSAPSRALVSSLTTSIFPNRLYFNAVGCHISQLRYW
jgi:hypothetical protein